MPTYTIQAQIIGTHSGNPIPNVEVFVYFEVNGQTWPKQTIVANNLGIAELKFDDSLFIQAQQAPIRVLFAYLRNGQEMAFDTRIEKLEPRDYGILTLRMPDGVDPLGLPYKVSGLVRDAFLKPLRDMGIEVADVDLWEETPLGQTFTDAEGYWEVLYNSVQFRRAEKQSADLVVRVKSAAGMPLAESDILYQAPPLATVDFTLSLQALGLSEYEQYHATLLPVLDGRSVAEVPDNKFDFLSRETEIPVQHLNYLRQDQRDSLPNQIPAGALYGLYRQGLSADLRLLTAEKPARWKAALEVSLKNNIIPASLAEQLDYILMRLREHSIELAFQPATDSSSAPLGIVLNTSTLPSDAQRRIVAALKDHEPTAGQDEWQLLQDQAGLTEAELQTTRFTLETNRLINGHQPTLQAVQQLRQTRGWTNTRDLARLNRAEWAALAQTLPLPEGFSDAPTYAEALAFQVEAAFPTAAYMHRLATQGDPANLDVAAFLSANHTFDLLHTPVDAYLNNGADLGQVSDPEQLRVDLKRDQRLARIAPVRDKFGVIVALKQQNIHTALQIAATGEQPFVHLLQSAVGETVARDVYARAQARANLLQLTVTGIKDMMPGMAVIPSALGATGTGQLPTWANLFGTLNTCACEHCRSVYSPAAYLVDLFQFLKKAPRPAGASLLTDVLFGRRPELPHILLNCDNANVPMPYIDLVNEVFERHIAGNSALPWNQTVVTEASDKLKIRAQPQYELRPAYDLLALAHYPWVLPFNLAHEKARAFAEHIGVPVYEAFELAGRTEVEIARAHLWLNAADHALITTDVIATPGLLEGYWGIRDSWGENLADLERIPMLMDRSGLDYEALQQVLAMTVFAPMELTLDRSIDLCNYERHQLQGLSDHTRRAFFDLLHRLLRLQRALGWPVEQFIAVMDALPLVEYREDEALDAYLARTSTAISESIPVISKLIRVADRLRLSVEKVAPLQTDDDVARAMRISLETLRLLFRLTGAARPGSATSGGERIRRLFDLIGHFDFLQQTAVDLPELAYLLRHEDLVPAVFRPKPEAIEQFWRALYQAVRVRPEGQPPAQVVVEQLAQHWNLSADVWHLLLLTNMGTPAAARYLLHSGDSGVSLMTRLEGLIHADVFPMEVPSDLNDWYIRLDKVARLLSGLGFSLIELQKIYALPPEAGVLDLNTLPARPGVFAAFEGWKWMVRAKALQRRMPKADLDIFDLLGEAYRGAPGTNRGVVDDRLYMTFGYNEHELGNLYGTLQIANLGDYRDLGAFERLEDALAWLHRWNSRDGRLSDWATDDPEQLSATLETSARNRYGDDLASWYKALTPMMDRLRERKRDALGAFLLANPLIERDLPIWSDVNDLYAHFLMDPQMNACQLSSRIVQAHNTVQLFVQRLLMGLEATRLGDSEREAVYWKQWEWMKNYRIWEANRKVFLYPENWIEPDLRDNKSPFFEELENELLQDEVTRERVEQIYRGYLTKLDEVARLDVRALYEEVQEDGEKVLHVVGRTYSQPHLYYYRKRGTDRVWTAWEKIDVGIEGEHLIPVVQKGRLMIFWPKFKEIQMPTTEGGERNEADNRRWELSLNWSEYYNGSWQAPKSGGEKLITRYLLQSDFGFRASTANNALQILVYEQVNMREGSDIIPDSYSVCFQGFHYRICEDTVSTFQVSPQRIFLHPESVDAADNRFKEEEREADNPLVLNVGSVADDTVDINPEVLALSARLIQEGGIVGLLLALFIGAGRIWEEISNIKHSVRPFLLLNATPGKFVMVPPHQYAQFTAFQPFFFSMEGRNYVVSSRQVAYRAESALTGGFSPVIGTDIIPLGRGSASIEMPVYAFENFYHPFICTLVERIRAGGLDSVLGAPLSDRILHRQLYKEGYLSELVRKPIEFRSYEPQIISVWQNHTDPYEIYPYEHFDFSQEGAYSLYNWELFFHIPLLVADRLSKNQKFEEARRWFHYIFDPTDVSPAPAPAKFWKIKPFYEMALRWTGPAETLEEMMRRLATGSADVALQVDAWRDNPFNPHLIARLRPVAYMKTVVMKYVENTIAWGDHLFRRDTMESINEATQLYLLASELLGKRPVRIPAHERTDLDYEQVATSLDTFSNLLTDLETGQPADIDVRSARRGNVPPPDLALYFCIPDNDKILGFWDTVADRLFKIRNCMNIEGQARQLALFDPPIDPALLVRARAAGLDLAAIVGGLMDLRSPHYRFTYMIQKAQEFCGEVRGFGNALLSALEKKDAEDLNLLRSRHEIALLRLVRFVKDRQLEEAKEALEGVRASRRLAEKRLDFYSQNAAEFRSASEKVQLAKLNEAHNVEMVGHGLQIASAIAHMFPQITATFPPEVEWGGTNVGNALDAGAAALRMVAAQLSYDANMASMQAGHERRRDDWQLQADLAQKELDQIDKQILAAEIRVAIAELEISNHEKQLEQAEAVEAFQKSKFTNKQLYSWQVAQLASLHYQAYQMAFDLAKKTQKAAQTELGIPASELDIIAFDNWDSLRKGLLAGERLGQQLRRLEHAYLDKNRREFELTKHISLQQLHPLALLQLRETGSCHFSIPEELFDLDFPGHTFRRIKSVSLSIPCVAGPYTSINATLRLNLDSGLSSVPPIATSTAQNDGGLFELNFRDERYLPFEYHDAVSNWTLEMMEYKNLRQFDYNTIADVMVHLRYTAREGNIDSKAAALAGLHAITDNLSGTRLVRLFNLRHDFPNEWRLMTQQPDRTLRLVLEPSKFPYLAQLGNLTINDLTLFTDGTLAAATLDGGAVVFMSGGSNIGTLQQFRLADLSQTLPATASLGFDPGTTVPAQAFLLVGYSM